jgi:hypothetical protein
MTKETSGCKFVARGCKALKYEIQNKGTRKRRTKEVNEMMTTENQMSKWRSTEMSSEVGTLFIHKEKNEGEKAVYHLSTPGENNSCTWTRHASVLLAMNTVHIGPVLTGAEPSFNPEPSPESLPKSTPVPAGWDSVDNTNEYEEEEVHMKFIPKVLPAREIPGMGVLPSCADGFTIETEIGVLHVTKCAGGWGAHLLKEDGTSYPSRQDPYRMDFAHMATRKSAVSIYVSVAKGERPAQSGLMK